MSVLLITDSASDLCREDAARWDVRVVPLTVRFGGREYLDGVDLPADEFYRRLAGCRELPATSQVPPARFEAQLARLAPGGEAVIITLSGALSGTYQSAVLAAGRFRGRVRVVDSRSVSAGERALVEYAVRLRGEGLSAAELCARLEEKKRSLCVLGVVDTLEYLYRGGRLSRTAAFAGGLLNIKPVLWVKEGSLELLGRARGLRQSNNLLNETAARLGGIDFSMPFAVAWSGTDPLPAQRYLEESRALWQHAAAAVPLVRIGSTIGAHVGPGAVAAAFFAPAEI